MAAEDTKSPWTVRIDLSVSQMERVAQAFGEGQLAARDMSLELTVEELERRIMPRIALN